MKTSRNPLEAAAVLDRRARMDLMAHDLIFYQLSRSKVERGGFSHFLDSFALDKLPTGRRLRERMNAMIPCISGYDSDPREIHSIPEVRRFYRAFHAAWPYWLYFCNLDQDVLKMMIFCCLDRFSALQVAGQPTCVVEADREAVRAFITADLVHLHAICKRAQMFDHLIEARERAISEHFGLGDSASR